MLRKVAIVDDLEPNVVEGHELMKVPVAEKVLDVGEPPVEELPVRTLVFVNAMAELGVLFLEVKVAHKVNLFHLLPALGEAETGDHGDDQHDGIEDCEKEDEHMGELEGQDGVTRGLGDSLVENEDEGDEAENHKLSVENSSDGLEMLVFVIDPVLEAVQKCLKDEGEDYESDEQPLGEPGGDGSCRHLAGSLQRSGCGINEVPRECSSMMKR